MNRLFKELFKLTVSQLLAFIFFAATLFYEISVLDWDSSNLQYAKYWNPPLLIILIFLNGSRIFLANWETEEDHFHTKIVNFTPTLPSKKKSSKIIDSLFRITLFLRLNPPKNRIDWLFRFYWLLAVYVLPFLVHFSHNSLVFAVIIPIYFLLLYVTLFLWDLKILKWIGEYRNEMSPSEFAVKDREIDECRPTFGDICNSAFRRPNYCDKDISKRGKPKWKLKNFEEKTVLWKAIDIVCLVGLAIYCFIIMCSYLSNHLTVKDNILLTIALYLLSSIILLSFWVEFLFNLEDYYRRLFWCLITSAVVGFIIVRVGKYQKREQTSFDILKRDLMQTDSTFSKLSEQKGSNFAFTEYVDSNATMFSVYNIPLDGKNFIVNYLMVHSDSLYKLTWKPIGVDIAFSGDCGFTFGTYYLEIKDSIKQTGNYCTEWKKDKNNNWKVKLNYGKDGTYLIKNK